MTKVIQPKIKIIPRTKNLRPLSPDAQKYSPPKPVNYRSPSPYARIANCEIRSKTKIIQE